MAIVKPLTAAVRSVFAEASVRKKRLTAGAANCQPSNQKRTNVAVKAHSATGSGAGLRWTPLRSKREKESFGGKRTMRQRKRRRKVLELPVLFLPFF